MVDHTGTYCVTFFTCGETPCALIRDSFEIENCFSKVDNFEGSHKEKRVLILYTLRQTYLQW